MIYSIEFIKSIHDNIIKTNKLDNDVISRIQNLSDKVLSPDYSKTPVFKKRSNFATYNYSKFLQHESTKIINNKDVLNDVKCLMNKLSNDTKKDIFQQILKKINSCEQKQVKDIIELLFNVKTSSIKYIQTLSELIKQLVDNKNTIMIYINECVNNIVNNFTTIMCDESDYDNFCKNNERMENKTSQYILISLLTKCNVLEKFNIEMLLNLLFKQVITNLKNENLKILNEYYVKNICKVLTLLCDLEYVDELMGCFNKQILFILTACSNKTQNKGLSKKCCFNIMDYCDENGLEY